MTVLLHVVVTNKLIPKRRIAIIPVTEVAPAIESVHVLTAGMVVREIPTAALTLDQDWPDA